MLTGGGCYETRREAVSSRRGGSGVEWCGDACVALAGGRRHSRDQDEGDASVPTPLPTSPAYTGRFFGADRHIRRGGSGVDVGRGRLRRPWGEAPGDWRLGRGRRKRPHPPHPPPPPLRVRRRFRSVMIKNLPLKALPPPLRVRRCFPSCKVLGERLVTAVPLSS